MRQARLTVALTAVCIQGCWMSFGIESEGVDTESGTPTEDTDSGSETETSTDYCADLPWEMDRNSINMLLMVDQSKSMIDNSMAGQTYAQVVADALSQTVEINDNSDLINFGLVFFPMPTYSYFYPDIDSACVPSTYVSNPIVEITPDNSTDIQTALNGNVVHGGTPTCQSLIWAESYLSGGSVDPEIAKLPTYVLLATDGAPNCNPELDINTCVSTANPSSSTAVSTNCLDDLCTYDAAKSLADAGFPVYVLGVGSATYEWQDVMNAIAENGGTESYFPSNNVNELQSALDEIANGAISCTYNLDWENVPDEIDGSPVIKSCSSPALFGRPWSGGDTKLTYMLDCNDENPSSEIYGWNWQYLGVQPENLDYQDLENCIVAELCPEACNKLKITDNGWETITAQFTCIQY